jgi:alkanesulfonate monooxygenase SsuD/methylene tetrahydromethanopterin reductase-like flavin-dependent oxidoreductase (luciferase family)
MLAFHMLCHEDAATAVALAKPPLDRFLESLVDAARDWTTGASSKDYPGYEALFKRLGEHTFERTVAQGAAWVGTPEGIAEQIREYAERVGGFEIASVQGNFNDLPYEQVERSFRLFASEVMPRFT